ncbi:MAG: hypothetical protein IK102_04180 [Treponema sp.]|nr:hypothetical protein [Treponema sp.]
MLNKLQSKVTIILVSLAVLCLSSCGNSLSVNKTNLAIDIPAQVFQQVAARTAYSEKGLPLSANVELFVDGKSYALDSQEYEEGKEASVLFRFKNIPVDSKAYAKVSIIQDDLELAQGDSQIITVKAGPNKIEVPLALIKYSVPKTKYVLYNNRYDNDICVDVKDCYLRDFPDAKITDADEPDFKNVVKYCFDAEGTFYAITVEGDVAEHNYYLESKNKKEVILDSVDSAYSVKQLICDYVTNELYFYYSYDADIIEIKNLTKKIVWNGDKYDLIHRTGDGVDVFSIVINDGYIYSLNEIEYNSFLFKSKILSSNTPNTFEIGDVIKSISIENVIEYGDDIWELNFGELYYQDGYFYITTYPENDEIAFINMGGIIKVSFDDPSPKYLGFNYKIQDFTSKGSFIIYREPTVDTGIYEYLVKKQDPSKLYSLSYSAVSGDTNMRSYFEKKYCQPQTEKSEQLFGLGYIVALKPKRLVFSDEGRFFYVDNDQNWKYKNVNRIVTVDLESFTIKRMVEPNVSFSEDYTEVENNVDNVNSSFIPEAKNGNGEYQKYNPSLEPENQIMDYTTDANWNMGIPCGD